MKLSHFGKFTLKNWLAAFLVISPLFGSSIVFSQKKVHFSDESFKRISKKTSFNYTDTFSLKNQLREIQFLAYKKGFLTFGIDSIVPADSLNSEAYFTLGACYKRLRLSISNNSRRALREIGISPRTIETLPPTPNEISKNLENILHQFENAGYPFAQITFEDLRVEIWEGIGHMPMVEAPAGSARLYREFLASQRQESPQDQRMH